jgi:hypothetical protein
LFAVAILLLSIGSVVAAEPAPAAGAAPKKNFELKIIRVQNTFQAIRLKSSTGETWLVSKDHFERIPETGVLPAGAYDVQLITDDTNWMAFRIERVSGATWQLRGNRWIKIKEGEEKAP